MALIIAVIKDKGDKIITTGTSSKLITIVETIYSLKMHQIISQGV